MGNSDRTMAQQIAQAASAFEQRQTGNGRKWVTVFLNEDTLVITLHAAMSLAEMAQVTSPGGAAQVREFHRELFANASDPLGKEIERITGMEVREATAQIETTAGAIVHVFTTGAVLQEFLRPASVRADAFSGSGTGDHQAERAAQS